MYTYIYFFPHKIWTPIFDPFLSEVDALTIIFGIYQKRPLYIRGQIYQSRIFKAFCDQSNFEFSFEPFLFRRRSRKRGTIYIHIHIYIYIYPHYGDVSIYIYKYKRMILWSFDIFEILLILRFSTRCEQFCICYIGLLHPLHFLYLLTICFVFQVFFTCSCCFIFWFVQRFSFIFRISWHVRQFSNMFNYFRQFSTMFKIWLICCLPFKIWPKFCICLKNMI